MSLDDECELIERSKDDPEAFGVLFDTYYDRIFMYVVKRTGNVQMAEDITAETFIKAYKSIDRFHWKGISISAWFYRIATNEVRSYFRHGMRYAAVSLDELYERDGFEPVGRSDIQNEAMNAQAVLERNAAYLAALELLRKLPGKYQEVVVLRFVERKKIAEIALIVDRKEGTVKSLLSRALARLRKEMMAHGTQPIDLFDVVDSEDIVNESYAE